jgi:hypothetical protein
MARSTQLTRFASLIVALAVAGLLSVACDSGTEEPDAPTPAPLEIEDSAPTDAKTDPILDSGFAASRYPSDLPEGVLATVPDNFPKDLPLYPGSAPAQGRGVEVEGVPMAALQLLTMDPPETVYDFYREKLQTEGWEIEDREEFRGKNAISASNGKCKASMLVTPTEDGGSDIFLISEC